MSKYRTYISSWVKVQIITTVGHDCIACTFKYYSINIIEELKFVLCIGIIFYDMSIH